MTELGSICSIVLFQDIMVLKYGHMNFQCSDFLLRDLSFILKWHYKLCFYVAQLQSKKVKFINQFSFKNIYAKKDTEHFKKTFKLKMFIAHISFFFLHIGICFLASYFSLNDIATTHTRTVLMAYGGPYLLVTLRMQYTHVT